MYPHLKYSTNDIMSFLGCHISWYNIYDDLQWWWGFDHSIKALSVFPCLVTINYLEVDNTLLWVYYKHLKISWSILIKMVSGTSLYYGSSKSYFPSIIPHPKSAEKKLPSILLSDFSSDVIYKWCWIFFHVFIGQLSIFFPEICI